MIHFQHIYIMWLHFIFITVSGLIHQTNLLNRWNDEREACHCCWQSGRSWELASLSKGIPYVIKALSLPSNGLEKTPIHLKWTNRILIPKVKLFSHQNKIRMQTKMWLHSEWVRQPQNCHRFVSNVAQFWMVHKSMWLLRSWTIRLQTTWIAQRKTKREIRQVKKTKLFYIWHKVLCSCTVRIQLRKKVDRKFKFSSPLKFYPYLKKHIWKIYLSPDWTTWGWWSELS